MERAKLSVTEALLLLKGGRNKKQKEQDREHPERIDQRKLSLNERVMYNFGRSNDKSRTGCFSELS